MSTQAERLASLEATLDAVRVDVVEVKADVKKLLAWQSENIGGAGLLIRAVPWLALGVSFWALIAR